MTVNHFSIRLWCATNSGFYTDNRLSGWSEKKFQNTSRVKLAPKRGHGQCLVVCCWSDLLQLSVSWQNITSEKYAQQFDELHQKLQCLQLALVNRKGPILLHENAQLHISQPTLQQLNKLGYEVLPHPPYSPDLSPNDYHFFKHLWRLFAGKTLPQPAGCRKCFPRVCWILKYGFNAIGINKLISQWQKKKMCWL